jgi:exodeoxyribonuclease VII large subunit
MSTMPLFDRPGVRDGDDGDERDRVLRVSEINRAVRSSLEEGWPNVWIEGELSDVTRAASGHVYFVLADEKEPAQIRGVMFRGDARRARARLEAGNRIRIRGGLSLYEPRGIFQVIARIALPAGGGDLAAQFERIRKKLQAEGLFDPARKRELPHLPRTVGVVTSASGAAMHDIVRVARGRCPVRIVVADCRVQGEGAPTSIVRALEAVQRLAHLDVVIVARGGGSAEELWAFNDEQVARAVAACRVPIVSGVGHETDMSISDLIADARGSTPSNAAELVVPDKQSLEAELDGLRRRLERALDTRVGQDRLRLERLTRRVGDPRHAVGRTRKRLEALNVTLARLIRRRLAAERSALNGLASRLARHDPRAALGRDRRTLAELRSRLEAAMRTTLTHRRHALASTHAIVRSHGRPLIERRRATTTELTARLDAMSPLKVLARGYAIALHERTGRALMRAEDASEGDSLMVRLSEGKIRARVEQTWTEPEDPPK